MPHPHSPIPRQSQMCPVGKENTSRCIKTHRGSPMHKYIHKDTNPADTTPLTETCNHRTQSQTSKGRHTDGEAVTQRQKEKRTRVSSHGVPDSQVQECRRPNSRQLWDPGPGGGHPQCRGQKSPPLQPELSSEPLPRLFGSQGRTKVRGHGT